MSEHSVYKTLVIGIGSTGARIVNRLASAVEWELGSIDRAPWLEYLCLETDANERTKLPNVRSEDFYQLGISKTDFQLMVADPAQFDASIGLSGWIDSETVQQLPDGSVQSGVGNIRMIGRLAFLHQPNFDAVKQRVSRRLDRLRQLTATEATEARGHLPNGDEAPVAFADAGVQVYVVGTLCGGTSSGAASDVGYFVRSLLEKDDTVTAMFTVPRPDLTAATVSDAERFKKNAYHALVELNHYHLPDRANEAPIMFPDGTRSVVGQFPYDLTYILMPKRLGLTGEEQVNQAVADRLFMHVFSVSTNTAGAAVNAVPFGTQIASGRANDFVDRDHRAHVFCTFGLAVVDYPVQRVVEACQARLLKESLGRTISVRPDEAAVQAALAGMRLSWDDLVDDLFDVDDGLEQQLKQEASTIVTLARSDARQALDRFERLRGAFRADGAAGAAMFDRGGVTEALRKRRLQVVGRIRTRIVEAVRRMLADPDAGVDTAIATLEAARTQMAAIRAGVDIRPPMVDLEHQASVIAQTARHPLLTLLGVASAATRRASATFSRDLSEAVSALQRTGAAHALVGEARFQGDGGHRGIANDVEHMLHVASQRTKNLRERLMERRHEAAATFQKVDRATPANGSTLYEPASADGGSVAEAYDEALIRYVSQPGVDVDDARRVVMREVFGELASVADTIVAAADSMARDTWLDMPFVRGSDVQTLDKDLAKRLQDTALRPFRSVSEANVLSHLQPPHRSEAAAERLLTDAGEASAPFLDVQLTLARRGNRSPISENGIALVPAGNELATRIRDRIANYMRKEPKQIVTSDAPHQIVMIQEMYRFPLSGVPSIVGARGAGAHLGEAECNDFPTFWTRSDVAWTGLSDKEVDAVRQAEETVLTVLLTGVGEVRSGALVVPWTESFGRQPERRLRPLFRNAVRQVADESSDMTGASLSGAQAYLFDSVIARFRSSYDVDDLGQPSFERYVVKYLDELVRNPPGVPIPDFPQGERLRSLAYRFVSRRPEWLAELNRIHPIDQAILGRLSKTRGEILTNNVPAPADGLYCPAPNCGSLIGESVEDAARNGWQCFAYPEQHNRENNFGIR